MASSRPRQPTGPVAAGATPGVLAALAAGAASLLMRLPAPRPPQSIRNRLTLWFMATALVAVFAIYIAVAPSLGSSLRAEKLSSLAADALAYSPSIARTIGTNDSSGQVGSAVRHAAGRSHDQVTLLSVSSGTAGSEVALSADSESTPPGGLSPQLATARQAARTGRTVTVSSGTLGVAALPLTYDHRVVDVVVFTQTLGDVQRTVSLILRHILLAGLLALVLAALAGTLVARALSARISGLQLAAERVAAGDFSTRLTVTSQDELGQLARALDDMQRQLAQLDGARERFIATASHELRTPIFSLGGFLELIQDEDLDEDTRMQFLGQVREQVDRLGKLATGLLDLSRLESGALELHSQSSDLGEITRTVTEEFVPALTQHASRLRLRVPGERIPVRCDPERVAQILRILIDNALAHTPQGTDIVVTAQYHQDIAQVAVRDYGSGIAPQALARIFEPFFTSDEVQGSGLGLAIARELAERMRGRLFVDSTPGRTVFTLEIPSPGSLQS
ncbi:MAG TPA: HAMP domain-containing sensor histidine kinase [Solirubrobacteraceae bacterium]|jgi:signal transduction histidine kinase|nr:HAMP domain-containing sensor histidine kinase [Solirubrobacteraceae bacterium]